MTAGKLGGCTWPGVPLPQKREDGGGDDDAEGNAGEDLRWRVITQLDPRPGDDGHQGLCGQQRLSHRRSWLLTAAGVALPLLAVGALAATAAATFTPHLRPSRRVFASNL